MTDSEHAALSAQLAKSLGWLIVTIDDRLYCDTADALWVPGACFVRMLANQSRLEFSYRDPTVYGPLIEWLAQPYGSFLCVPHEDSWTVLVIRDEGGDDGEKQYRIDAGTLPEAVARAVIAVNARA